MSEGELAYTHASMPVLRWLTDAGPRVPAGIRDRLLAEPFTSPVAVLLGVLNGLVINVTAVFLQHGAVFAWFMGLDLRLSAVRLLVLRQVALARRHGGRTPNDLYLVTGILWSALQGAMAFTAMSTQIHPLQVLVATTIMGLLGRLCARNYPAPRLALLPVSLCDLPFIAGAAVAQEPWLLVLLLQSPLYLYGTMVIISRFQSLAVANPQAKHDSHDVARHDPLTGLLNCIGLTEILAAQDGDVARGDVAPCYSLFYLDLDLDGFKRINDSFGHQTGDSLLQAVELRLKASIRSGDVVARLGGDEFVAVAPGMTHAESGSFAGNIIRRAAGRPYQLDVEEPLRIGVSIGFACAPEDGAGSKTLHSRADAALYEAKAEGRGIQKRYQPRPRVLLSGALPVASA